ncbi:MULTISPECIES: ECF transporter S component [Bacillaceae]|uniref:ECF transporter S component n=1 Tax=Domibacillus aminovorans TaxID=29332 RepID=A0A177KJ74_9BACI|nr:MULTISPECIES: ECF transporter S component [Bacillaceae]OAH53177.1 hypothetical protein AWH48_12535 [Domibacillus aminovorans]
MNAKKISWLALFVALSVVGGMIKVPAPISSVALDSFPALVAAVLLGPVAGALVGAFGHLVSALIGGLPMGPLHLLIAIEMAAIVWLFGQLYVAVRKWAAIVTFILLNGFVLPAPFILLMGMPFYIGAVPGITMAAIFNTMIAAILIPRIVLAFEKRFGRLNA